MLPRGFNLLTLVLLSSVIEQAITAVNRNPYNRVPVKSTPPVAVLNQPWASISPLLRNNFGEEGVDGTGGVETAAVGCQCVMFYLCEEATTVKNDTQCDEPMICCKTDTKLQVLEDSLATSESAEFSESSSSSTSSELILFPELESSSAPSSTSEEIVVDGQSAVSSILTESSVDNQQPSSTTPFDADVFVECGIDGSIELKPAIITDENAFFKEFPWMVAILKTSQDSTGDTLICGGSLLSPYIVLTAAHCVHNLDPSTLKIRAGDLILNTDSPEETLPYQDRTIKSIITHTNFSSRILHNDLALINVDEPFVYNSHIALVCSPATDAWFASVESYDPNNCIVTGWTRNAIDNGADRLRRVHAKVMNKSNCEEDLRGTRLGRTFKLHPSFLCAKEEDSVCKGDGGGPLVCISRTNPRKYIQVGVVSWGVGCDLKLPGVYASLEANSQWIATEFDNLNALRGYSR